MKTATQTIAVGCTECGRNLMSGEGIRVAGSQQTGPLTFCPDCFARAQAVFQAETEGADLIPAILLGVVAGLLAAGIWFGLIVVTDYQLGIVAVGLGWLVAQAVRFGSGGKRGGALPWISVGITLVAMALAEYLTMRHFLAQLALEQEGIALPLILPLDLSFELVLEGLKMDPLTLVFWAVALIEAFAFARKGGLQRV